MLTRQDKIQKARELHAKGYTTKQIANRINVTFTTAKRYAMPSYDRIMSERERERKKRYRGTCAECGATTSYSGHGSSGSTYCRNCAPGKNKIWTRERVISAIKEWNEEHGRPPSSTDWNRTLSKRKKDPRYPSANTVYGPSGVFPTWADAIEAAGFPRPRTTYWGKLGEMYWTEERTLEALKKYAVDGVAPKQASWSRRGEDRPTSSWVGRLFGSWTAACHEAGLITAQEAYYHGRYTEFVALPQTEEQLSERLAFVRRAMEDGVPRRFIARQLWQAWGFASPRKLSIWLSAQGIGENPGYHFQPRRQLTKEELDEARALASLPPAV